MERCGEESQITKTRKKHKFQTSVKLPNIMTSIIVLYIKNDIHYEGKQDEDVKKIHRWR